jgi:hypothetical protein
MSDTKDKRGRLLAWLLVCLAPLALALELYEAARPLLQRWRYQARATPDREDHSESASRSRP